MFLNIFHKVYCTYQSNDRLSHDLLLICFYYFEYFCCCRQHICGRVLSTQSFLATMLHYCVMKVHTHNVLIRTHFILLPLILVLFFLNRIGTTITILILCKSIYLYERKLLIFFTHLINYFDLTVCDIMTPSLFYFFYLCNLFKIIFIAYDDKKKTTTEISVLQLTNLK